MSSVPRERVKRERCAPRQDQRSGGKSVATPVTVSGESLVHPFPSGRVTELERFGKAGPEALTREPGDLPSSHEPLPPGGVYRG